MLTDEQGMTPVSGFHVYDMVLLKHIVDKLLRHGLVTGKELSYVASIRNKALAAAHAAVGVNIEEVGSQPAQPQET